MHTGEEWFSLDWHHYAAFTVLLLSYVILQILGKLPSMAAFKDFTDTINTAGGHIVVLGLFAAWSIKITMQFFYHVLSLSSEMITKSDAVVLAMFAFVTGNLCGTFISAMIKTMSGGKANGVTPPADQPDTLTASLKPEEK